MPFAPRFHQQQHQAMGLSLAIRSPECIRSNEPDDIEEADDDGVRIQCSLAWSPAFPPLSNAANGGLMPDEIIWMPVGTHEVHSGVKGGGRNESIIKVDETTFAAVKKDFDEFRGDGDEFFIDFDHQGLEPGETPAGYVLDFYWDSTRGIIAKVKWTERGEDAVRTRKFTSFSPCFYLHKITNAVLGLFDEFSGSVDVGGLVNDPAFRAMPQLSF